MSKKNRFTMLEGIGKNPETSKEDTIQDTKSRPKDVQVVVPQDAFEQNLKKHKLTEKISDIEKQKIDIKIQINKARLRAMTWITLGVFFIAIAFNKFGKRTITRTEVGETEGTHFVNETVMSSTNYLIVGVLVLVFYFYNRKGKK